MAFHKCFAYVTWSPVHAAQRTERTSE